MMIRNFSLCLIATLMSCCFVGGQEARAATVKIDLSNESYVDPETGRTSYPVLNPSGEVDITYTSSGANLKFVGRDGMADAFSISANFLNQPLSESKDPVQNVYNQVMAQTITANGKKMPAAVIKNISAEFAQQGMKALLYFDQTGRIGFHIREFDAHEIKIIAGPNSVTLAQAIFNAISATAKVQTVQIIEKQHQALKAKKNACSVLFTSAL